MRKPSSPHTYRLTPALSLILALAGICLVLPVSAGAYATVAPGPEPGAPGLPDGRVYSQVSPENKSGNEAGTPSVGNPPTMLAAANGESVMFSGNGPIGHSPSQDIPAQAGKATARSLGRWAIRNTYGRSRSRSASQPI
jgi:hypothetical protein